MLTTSKVAATNWHDRLANAIVASNRSILNISACWIKLESQTQTRPTQFFVAQPASTTRQAGKPLIV
jgi:hypothetical protein